MNNGTNPVGLIVLAIVVTIIALCLYMFPLVIAWYREAPNKGSIAAINMLLGWTLVGWVVALAMALRDVPLPRLEPEEIAEIEAQLDAEFGPAPGPILPAPILSPDGAFYWTGQGWAPMPTKKTEE
jgi:hypothetical protein